MAPACSIKSMPGKKVGPGTEYRVGNECTSKYKLACRHPVKAARVYTHKQENGRISTYTQVYLVCMYASRRYESNYSYTWYPLPGMWLSSTAGGRVGTPVTAIVDGNIRSVLKLL